MTVIEKKTIKYLRVKGALYSEIASELGIHPETVRSFCRKEGLSNIAPDGNKNCIECGEESDKIFCSEKCRSAWRRSTGRLSEKTYHHTCAGCGIEFDTVGNKNQSYCSLRCYHTHRKGGAA